MNKSVLQTIRNGMDTFSKGQKRIARYILENYDKAAFMTASKLGQTAQVSESTVVRFAAELGYNGYPDMQKALQELIRGKLTSIQRIQVSSDQMSGSDILGSVMQRDMRSWTATSSSGWWTSCSTPSTSIYWAFVRPRFWRAISTSICT